ncbi:hypothetical protein BKP45_14010 [Anaerobacillus alkalidiazotrophicus]|uniref:Uncharacterized protein n=1 Tax=Anaerobacillus alkalidiazotrophicus TaxID=472963 RepID=A0A1S2M5Y1_9BACI|nr:hypothetical protein BKP45_14010 [Anaerobacillus alkalidiazotrophicus]
MFYIVIVVMSGWSQKRRQEVKEKTCHSFWRKSDDDYEIKDNCSKGTYRARVSFFYVLLNSL